MTNKEEQFLNNYLNATYTSVNDFYTKPSREKRRAETLILQYMLKDNGEDYRICGGNSCTFSCAYRFTKDNKKFLKYFTRYNIYVIEVNQK